MLYLKEIKIRNLQHSLIQDLQKSFKNTKMHLILLTFFVSTFIYLPFDHTDRIYMSTPLNHDKFCCFVYHVSVFDVYANLFNIMTTVL